MSDELKTTQTTETAGAEKKKGTKKAVTKPKSRKKKATKEVTLGRAYIHATYNNTIVTITDNHGNALGWSSAGHMGFKGPKKATPYAASMVVKELVEKIEPYNVKEVSVFVKGIGAGRDGAIRALYTNNLNVTSIKDITPIPHNGCRPPKVRRV
ncbi:MAG TPA: 30S ribosomal protein S11 [Candidatus Magasanikbacteria bacterium]|nr:30S ribosomal protein S11 [Candidatus Magasanikbacteria bacterium]